MPFASILRAPDLLGRIPGTPPGKHTVGSLQPGLFRGVWPRWGVLSLDRDETHSGSAKMGREDASLLLESHPLETAAEPCFRPGVALDVGDRLGPRSPGSWGAWEERSIKPQNSLQRAFHVEMRHKDTKQGKVAEGRCGRAQERAAPARARETRTRLPSEKSKSKEAGQLYIYFIVIKEPFPPPQTVREGKKDLLTFPRAPPNQFRVFRSFFHRPGAGPLR